MNKLWQKTTVSLKYIKSLLKWLILAAIVGLIGGVVGSLFHKSIDAVTYLRGQNKWIIYLLPLGALTIALLYSLCKRFGRMDTNRILDSVSGNEKVPFVLLPLIFVSSVITHLVGGSAGREGAALQLGGAIGYRIGKSIRLSRDDMHIVVMTGMSAVFTALFGTPITACIFAIEVTSVGVMHYSALFPCIVSSMTAYGVAIGMGIEPVAFEGITIGSVSLVMTLKIVLLTVMCATVSIIFCASIKTAERWSKRFIPNPYLRALSGGAIILILTLTVGTYDYNGAGMNVIQRALEGNARYEAFALKILFTAITISAGFKGGEIVPAFFVGSTFGCVFAELIGMNSGFGAAIGFVALFCGVVNCPLASLMLSLEVFGSDSIIMFALVCAISYMMSGNYGLYKSQKIVYSKLDFEKIDVNAT